MGTNALLDKLKQDQKASIFGVTLPYKQRRFVMIYDGTDKQGVAKAAKKLKVHPSTIQNWLKKPDILNAILNRDSIYDEAIVATRLQRKEFWTDVLFDDSAEMNHRLKASELLGKSECDFSETRVLKGSGSKGTTIIVNTGIPRAPGAEGAEKTDEEKQAELESKEEMRVETEDAEVIITSTNEALESIW